MYSIKLSEATHNVSSCGQKEQKLEGTCAMLDLSSLNILRLFVPFRLGKIVLFLMPGIALKNDFI